MQVNLSGILLCRVTKSEYFFLAICSIIIKIQLSISSHQLVISCLRHGIDLFKIINCHYRNSSKKWTSRKCTRLKLAYAYFQKSAVTINKKFIQILHLFNWFISISHFGSQTINNLCSIFISNSFKNINRYLLERRNASGVSCKENCLDGNFKQNESQLPRITNLYNHVWKFLCKVFNAGSSLSTSNNNLQKQNPKKKNCNCNEAHICLLVKSKETKIGKSCIKHDIEVMRI